MESMANIHELTLNSLANLPIFGPGDGFVFSEHPFFVHGIVTGVLTTISFVLANLPYALLLWLKIPFFNRYRLQPRVASKYGLKDWLRALRFLVRNMMILGAIMPLVVKLYVSYGIKSDSESLRELSATKFISSLVVCYLLDDAIFYWTHRALHHPRLYKRFHKEHHAFTSPIAMSAAYASPLEWLVSNNLPTIVGNILFFDHAFQVYLYAAIKVFHSAEIHSGYSFPWNIDNILERMFPSAPVFFCGSRHHEGHHEDGRVNFGAVWSFWDWLCGTGAGPKSVELTRRPSGGRLKLELQDIAPAPAKCE